MSVRRRFLPHEPVQVLAAALAAASLAIFAVGRAAYPITETTTDATALSSAAQAAARLRPGIRLSIVAVILAVIAAPSGWWPALQATAAMTVPAAALSGCGTQGQRLPSSIR